MAFSSDPTQQERLLENDVIPVVTNLHTLKLRPDIIHGQHHLDMMTALSALPGVPAIYMCHGAVWRESLPRHPRIYRYLTMSETMAERLAAESALAREDITVVLNSVDLDQFSTVRTPPARLQRALFYNSRHDDDSPTVAAVREAAGRLGLALDVFGSPFGQMTPFPERVLPDYDLTFASGLSAIEAIACGCAVVVLGRTSCGGLVTPETFDRYRRTNFTIAVNSPPPSADRIVDSLAGYDASGTAAVTARLRREADSRLAINALVGVYEQAMAAHRATTPAAEAEMRAMSDYLRKIVPLVRTTDLALGGLWSSPTRPETIEERPVSVVSPSRPLTDAE
jgi:hypothetical protein